MTQNSRYTMDFDADHQQALVTATANYILAVASKQHIIKPSEIIKNCLRGERILYERLMPRVLNILEHVYYMDIHMDQDTKLGRYILCVSTEPAVTPHEFTSLERHELRLLLLVLSYVFMKCDAVFEHVLFGYLSKLGLDNEPHEVFGYYRHLITDTFVRQMYLKKTTVQIEAGEIDDRIQYSWGYRAHLEFDKRNVLQFVADLFEKPAETFLKQFQVAHAEDEEEDEEEKLEE